MSFNRIDSVNGDSIEIRLRQLGASKIQKVQGICSAVCDRKCGIVDGVGNYPRE